MLRMSNGNVVEYGYRVRTTDVQGGFRSRAKYAIGSLKPRENGRRRKGFFRLSFLVLFFRRCSRIFAGEEKPRARIHTRGYVHTRVSARVYGLVRVIAEGGWSVSCVCDSDIYGPIESASVRRRREDEKKPDRRKKSGPPAPLPPPSPSPSPPPLCPLTLYRTNEGPAFAFGPPNRVCALRFFCGFNLN